MIPTSCNRRAAIANLAAIGAAAVRSLSAVGAEEPAPTPPAWIDTHAHIMTQDTEKYPPAKNSASESPTPRHFPAEALLQAGKPEGVTRFVLIQHQPIYGFDNSLVLDAAEAHPENFCVVGEIDDQLPNPERTMRSMATKRVSGFRITLLTRDDRWIDGPGMNAMWRTAAATGQAISLLTNPSYMESIDGMCGKYPDTKVVIDHFARIGVDGVIREDDVAALCKLAKRRNSYVKLSAFYGLGKKHPPYDDMIPLILRLVEAFSPERLMWGSDAPYQIEGDNSYRDSILVIRDRISSFSDDDKTHLLRKTAERVFFSDLNV